MNRSGMTLINVKNGCKINQTVENQHPTQIMHHT